MIIDFNDNWHFSSMRGEGGVVRLPHDAMLTGKRYAECRGGVQSGYFPGGKYAYEKRFTVVEGDLGKCIELRFEGVYRNATVLINGERAAFHAYGYTEFTVDISALVRAGENTVAVQVDNSLVPNCRWYSGSGIYRPVSLIIRDRCHITDPVVRTLSIAPATIEVSAGVTGDAVLTVEIFEGELQVASGCTGVFTIPDAKLWSAETPQLYTCVISCATDRVVIPFGIRLLEWSAGRGLLVNGEHTLLRGGCIHHDNGVLGACSYPDAELRRVSILREQGFNALRVAHNPASRALLDACDRLGMYVMDECYDGWYIPKDYHDYSRQFEDNYVDDLLSMVRKDVNHPCVIMYSVGNEVSETAERRGVELCARMRDIIKTVDDTRPVTCGVNILIDFYSRLGIGVYRDKGRYRPEPLPERRGRRERKTGSAFFNAMANKLRGLMFVLSRTRLSERIAREVAPSLDILGLNYASSRYDTDVRKYPERMMLGAETMVADLPYNWARVKRYPQLAGDFVWAAWDYLGEACIGDWTYHSYKGLPLLAGQGMIDITGKPLAAMAFMRIVWGLQKEPFIAVSPLNHAGETPSTGAWQFTNGVDSWSWRGFEGKKSRVEVFANAHSVRLLLDGKKLGCKRVKAFRAVFAVRFRPGELTAVALDRHGRELSRFSLTTGGEETRLTVRCDKPVMRSGELCYAEIEFTDGNGLLKPSIEQRVELSVDGDSCVLAGFGSALCKTDEVFDKPYHNSYRGRCLAVFRGVRVGVTAVTVRSQGAADIQFTIEVQ